MDKLTAIFTNRRGWVVLVPVIVVLSNFVGIDVTPEQLGAVGDQADKLVMSLLALWSLYRPKAAS